MSVYLITCPEKGRPVSTGVEAIEDVLPAIARKRATMVCPECGAVHGWTAARARVGEEPKPGRPVEKTAA